MASIQALREYTNATTFQEFLQKFHQSCANELKRANIIFEDESSIQSYNILSDDFKHSLLTLDDITSIILRDDELFFSYYKKFIFLYKDEKLVNEIDEEDDWVSEEDEEGEMVDCFSYINCCAIMACLIDFYLIKNNQAQLFDYHKKLRMPNAKKHSKNLIELFKNIV